MDWKQYTEQPDTDLFAAVERRLDRRRAWRIGAVMAAVVVATAAMIVFCVNRQYDNRDVVAVSTPVSDVSLEPVAKSTMPVPAEEHDAMHTNVVTIVEPKELPIVEDEPSAIVVPQVSMAIKSKPQTVAEPVRVGEAPQAKVDETIYAVASGVVDNEYDFITTEAAAMSPKVGQQSSDTLHAFSIIKAPNIIAPSGDVDENRYFSITPTATISDFKIQIYNRRGMRVFSSEDPQFRWDGSYDGAAVQQGGFVWVATFRDADGKARMERGTVVVVR